MIKRPTVLVLGAGASMHLGFPSGRQLVTKVVDGLRREDDQLFQILRAAGFEAAHIASFRDTLEWSGRSSVDVFLEYRPEFRPLGKTAIAAVLMPLEAEENLFRPNGDWYEYVYRHLGPSLTDVAQSRLSIITFNYDRSFEHYLFTALRNSFELDTSKALKYVRSIPIVHVYGQLGELSYVGGVGARPYQPSSDAQVALAAKDAIKIMHEGGTGDDLALGRAQQLVSEAEVICFLGFGYLEENLNRLRLDRRNDTARVWGSACRLGEGELAPIRTYFGSHGNKSHINLGGPGQDVMEFLRQHPVFA